MKNKLCYALWGLLMLWLPPVFSEGQQEGQKTGAELELSAPGEMPIAAEAISLDGFVPSIGFLSDWNTNASAVWLENQTNIHVDWLESSKVDAKNKLSIMLASGEYPDVIMGCNGSGLSVQDIYRYGRQGIFLPLDDLIEKDGFYIKEMFQREPWIKKAVTSPDGHIYGLPSVYTDDYHMTMRQKLWINQTWLDNLNLKMPETLDEFYTVMKAFKEQDANGNGNPHDEIPLTGAKRSQEDLALWIMNAFIPAGGPDESGDSLLNNYEFIIEDNVSFSADKPAFREGLRFIRKMYTEGLIDVAAFTQNRDQIKPLVDGGSVSLVGAAASHHPGNFASMSGGETARYRQYVAVPPVKGPSGAQNTPWIIDQVIVPGQLVLTDNCDAVEAAFKWADYFYSLDFALVDRGKEGTHWRKVDASENLTGLNGKPALYQYLKVLTPEDNAQINLGPGWTRDIKNEFATSEGYSYEEFLYDSTLSYDPYKVQRYPYATTSINENDVTEFNDLRRTLHTYIAESTDRFIIGDLDIEKDWDNYIRQLNQIGLDRYLEILNTAYTP